MKPYLKSIALLAVMLITSTATKAQNATDTVSLVVSGQGATLEEARINALRSAIEQAYGAFISTKTELLNDSLVKDEVVSVASGNILGYKTQSQVSIPDGGYGITLRTMVSVKNLTSFVESKGGSVDIKGGVFAANMKLKLLNEKAELAAVLNICEVSWNILSKSVDFELEVAKTPELINKEEQIYSLPMLIKAKTNENKTAFYNYFIESLKELSINKNELESYKLSKIPFYRLKTPNQEIYLRNDKSRLAINNLFLKCNIFYYYFKLVSNIDTIQVGDKYSFTIENRDSIYNRFSRCSNIPYFFNNQTQFHNTTCNPIISLKQESRLGSGACCDKDAQILFWLSTIIKPYLDPYDKEKILDIFKHRIFTDQKWQSKDSELNRDWYLNLGISWFNPIFPIEIDVNRTSYMNITLNKTFKLSELELLEGYRIEKIYLSGI